MNELREKRAVAILSRDIAWYDEPVLFSRLHVPTAKAVTIRWRRSISA